MDIMKMLAELRLEREQVEEAILTLERLAQGRGRGGGRPPMWMTQIKRRGRPEARTSPRIRGGAHWDPKDLWLQEHAPHQSAPLARTSCKIFLTRPSHCSREIGSQPEGLSKMASESIMRMHGTCPSWIAIILRGRCALCNVRIRSETLGSPGFTTTKSIFRFSSLMMETACV